MMSLQVRRTALQRDRAERLSYYLWKLNRLSYDSREADLHRTPASQSVFWRRLTDQGAEGVRKDFEDDPQMAGLILSEFGRVFTRRGLYANAEASYLQAIEVRRTIRGSDGMWVVASLEDLAKMYSIIGRYEDAETLYREALDIVQHTENAPSALARSVMVGLVEFYESTGRLEDARPIVALLLESAKDDAQNSVVGPPGHSSPDDYAKNRYAWLALTCEPEDLRDPRSALRFAGEANDATGHRLSEFLVTLALGHELTGNRPSASAALDKALENLLPLNTHERAPVWRRVLLVCNLLGRSEDARPLARELLKWKEQEAIRCDADLEAKVYYAQFALTLEPTDLRAPTSALRFALEANELSRFQNPHFLDTLALAYHRTGDFASAAETQENAISLLPQGGDPSEMERRLSDYEAALGRNPED